jgi:hypothetical protein
MTGSRLQKITVLFLLFLTIACSDESEPIYSVQDEFVPYVMQFIQEGTNRGYSVTIDNLIMEFGETDEEEYCGQCIYAPDDPTVQRRIVINSNSACWAMESEQSKEVLIFHELGHCVLNRINHKEDKLPNGAYASMMNRGELNLYEPCVYDIGDGDCDKSYRRTYYVDELFDENTPSPDWAN